MFNDDDRLPQGPMNDDPTEFDGDASFELSDFADDEREGQALAAMMQVARTAHNAPVDAFGTERQKRTLMRTIAERSRQPRLSGRYQAAAAVLVAAFSGAAVAFTAMSLREEAPAPRVETVQRASVSVRRPTTPPPADQSVGMPSPMAPDNVATTEKTSRKPRNKRSVKVARGTPTPLSVAHELLRESESAPLGSPKHLDAGDAAAMAGLPDEAVDAYVRALAGSSGTLARRRLMRVVSDGLTTVDRIELLIARSPRLQSSSAAQKVLCEWALSGTPTATGVRHCQRFVENFPGDRDAKLLATTAGRAAQQIGELKLANTLLTRAVMMSEHAGVSTSDAILARAHVLHELGDQASAGADLRMYVHLVPQSRDSEEIQALARDLDVDLTGP